MSVQSSAPRRYLEELPIGTRFVVAETGVTGRLTDLTATSAWVTLDTAREIVIHGVVKGRRRQRTHCSRQTEVVELPAEQAVVAGLPLFSGSASHPPAVGRGDSSAT